MFTGGIGSSNLLCSHSSYFTCSTQCHYLKSGLCNFSIYYWFVFPFVARIKLTAKHMYLQYEIMLNKKKLIKMLYSWPMPWTLTEMHHNCTALRMSKMQQQNCKVWVLVLQEVIHGTQGSGWRSSCGRQVQADDTMTDGKAMMNLGNKQIFSYQRDLVNTSDHAFLVNPVMNHYMPREASAFLSHILQESVPGMVRATTAASLPKMQSALDRENRNTPLPIWLF